MCTSKFVTKCSYMYNIEDNLEWILKTNFASSDLKLRSKNVLCINKSVLNCNNNN